MKTILALPLFCLLACCVAPKAEPPVAAPLPAPAPPPAVAPAPAQVIGWQDAPTTPGSWIYRRDARGSVAMFGRAGAEADFLIRCEGAAREIVLSRAWGGAPAGSAQMTIATSAGSAAYVAHAVAGGAPYVAATLRATDPQLDRIAYSRGRFAVQIAGQPRLVLPAGAEAARVFEDCRG